MCRIILEPLTRWMLQCVENRCALKRRLELSLSGISHTEGPSAKHTKLVLFFLRKNKHRSFLTHTEADDTQTHLYK